MEIVARPVPETSIIIIFQNFPGSKPQNVTDTNM